MGVVAAGGFVEEAGEEGFLEDDDGAVDGFGVVVEFIVDGDELEDCLE